MADLQELSRTAIAFSEYRPSGDPPVETLAQLDGGILRSIRGLNVNCRLPSKESHFGYVGQGRLHIVDDREHGIVIEAGWCFSVPGQTNLWLAGVCEAIVVSKPKHMSYFGAARVEDQGRLKYINGCTDSLLISPVKMGDPCLNLLYFPAHTDQTMHTHPSDRIGMVLSGSGVCVTEDDRGYLETPLVTGMLFCIHAGGRHKFATQNVPMRVLAYHPDSDFGPTDETHPMINRTMVGGVSASQLTELHTRNGQ